MNDLITLQQARDHLRIDDYDSSGGPDDPWLELFITATSYAVAEWLKDSWRLYVPALDSNGDVERDSNNHPVPDTDSNGDPTPLPIVKIAVLIELERQYRSRGGEDDTYVEGNGYVLGKGSTALLNSLRKSTVA